MNEPTRVTDLITALPPRLTCLRATTALLVLLCTSSAACAQEFDERFDDWPIDLKINGTLIAAQGCEDLAGSQEQLDELLPSKRAHLLHFGDSPQSAISALQHLLDEIVLTNLQELQDAADAPDVLVWDVTPSGLSSCEVQRAALSDALHSQLQAGKTLITLGLATELAANIRINSNSAHPTVGAGFHLFPDCLVKVDFESDPDRNRMLSVLTSNPRRVGIGIESGAVLVLSGRKLFVLGEGTATLLLMADEQQPPTTQTIAPKKSRRADPNEWLVDLTQWRRQAIDRTLDPFPPVNIEQPLVQQGALFIVGGGGLPEGLMEDFVDRAGGPERARLIYVPCSESDEVSERQSMLEAWREMGVQHASLIHTKDRRRASADEAFYAPLQGATGIWFGGGRQWNLADSYYGTTTHKLMKRVLQRGGVIGGSSAGASIQASYLARATPIQNFRIMAPGYERGGLGFIRGVAIDQHFTQRGRQADMTQLVNRYPQLLGIGIDETTAIIVEKSIASVVGKGKVHFYDRGQPVRPNEPDYIALAAGQKYDLSKRTEVEQ